MHLGMFNLLRLLLLLQKLLVLLLQLRVLFERLQRQVFVPKFVLLVFVRVFLQLLELLQLLLWVLADLRRMLNRLHFMLRMQLSGSSERLHAAICIAVGELSSSSSHRKRPSDRAGTQAGRSIGDYR